MDAYVSAFFVGGALCLIGQLLLDLVKWPFVRVMSSFVVLGVIIETFGWYDNVQIWAGAGVTATLVHVGHACVEGVKHGHFEDAVFLFSFPVFIAFLTALMFKPKGAKMNAEKKSHFSDRWR
jgi:stage V sporulation protein AE